MKCKVCGQELPDRAKFCFACGAPMDDVPAPKKLEEPLDPSLAGGAVPMVPVAPPPRATRVEPRAVRVRAARAVHPGSAQGGLERRFRETMLNTDSFPVQDLTGSRVAWDAGEKDVEAEQAEAAEKVEQVEAATEAPVDAAEATEPAADEAATEPEPTDAPAAEPEPSPAPEAGDETVAMTMPAEDAEVAEAEPAAQEPQASAEGAPAEDAAPAPSKRPTIQFDAFKEEATTRLGQAKDGFSGAVRDAFGDLPAVEKGLPRGALVAAFAVAVVVTVALIAFVSTSWLGPLAPEAQQAPVVQPPSDGSIAPLDEAEPEEETTEDDGSLPEGAPEPRAAVADYSWEELSQIADLIASAASDDEAITLAAQYNLCAADGSLDGSQAKDLELADGTTVSVRVAGFRQDERADGSGVAGITFVAEGPVAEMAMCPNAEKGSGWRDTTLRAWMNGELLESLPEELSGAVVTVNKTTNPVVGTGSEQIVTEDALWVPSYSELTGTVRDGAQQEGAQYRLFADLGVDGGGANSALSLGEVYWWERSPDQSNEAWFMCVGPDGAAATSHRPATPNGVVAGFCL